MISTNSFEFDYMIQGEVEYQISEETYIFKEGESMFLDSRIEHRVANTGNKEAIMLVVYFFITGDAN
ncbi:cupin domain-containing protein [Niabella ginsengisoli]|uniref:Cupin domain-containing protein n=1 Tax=Niabella ginsengisoli TaxID=522298 RepID=A0ABS9SIS3_9BACT|nr:cupin domain-containing protein [Niabella ginsengisoli]MCH5598283.1 cupin domain-containing protein [Niabella ginsengisoli]